MKSYDEYTQEDWDALDGVKWAKALRKRPEFCHRCVWEKLDKWDWMWLLGSRPEFAEIGIKYCKEAFSYIRFPTEEQQLLHQILWEL